MITPVESYETIHAEKGDVVRSDEFTLAVYADRVQSHLKVGRVTPGPCFETRKVKKYALVEGLEYERTEMVKEDISAHDKTRNNADFLVVEAWEYSGLIDSFDADSRGWRICASRLTQEGCYDKDAELIDTFQTGNYLHTLREPVIVVGKWPLDSFPLKVGN